MVGVNPVGGVHPAFGRWIDRRRERMRAQLSAMDDERFEALAQLIDDDDEDRPPQPQTDVEEEEYGRMLSDSEELVRRLAMIRSRLLMEIRDVERQQVSGAMVERPGGRGGSLDGYL